MKQRMMKLSLAVLFLVYGCAAPPYKEAFDNAMKAGDLGESYRILKETCAKEPDAGICAELGNITKKYAAAKREKLKTDMDAEKKPMSIAKLGQFRQEASDIKTIDPAADTAAVLDGISKEAQKTASAVEAALKEAESLLSAGQRGKAYDAANLAYFLDPSTKTRRDELSSKASEDAYAAGLKAEALGDWGAARAAFEDAFHINPELKDVKTKAEDARTKDTLEYHIAEAEKAEKDNNPVRAVELLRYAVRYSDTDEVKTLLNRASVKAANALFKEFVNLYNNEQPLSAGAAFIKGTALLQGVPQTMRAEVPVPSRDGSRLLDGLYVKGKSLWETGDRARAYLYMGTIARIQPDYPDVKQALERLKDEIRKRSTHSLAVIPFKSPSYDVDAGSAVTSGVLNFLYKELSNDVRILERSAIEALLKESEVKTLQGEQETKGFLQLLGADYLLLGDVINYRVESNVAETYKTIRAKTGTKSAPNPQYQEWLRARSETPAPPKQTEEPVYEDIKYKITHYRKTGNVAVSYRVVDSKGFVFYTGISEKKDEAEDQATEGIEIGEVKIPTKMAKIPSDSDLLRTVQAEVLEKVGENLKKLFANPEEKAVKDSDALKKAGNIHGAIEKAVSAIFIMEAKGKDTAAVEEMINTMIKEGRM